MTEPQMAFGDPVTEEELHQRIAFYKARLADIQKAPEGSPHRRGWDEATRRLQECRRKLRALHQHRRAGPPPSRHRAAAAGAQPFRPTERSGTGTG